MSPTGPMSIYMRSRSCSTITGAMLSLGHDEYWSSPMRDGAAQSLAGGVNLAFLGANACYRQIRFESSPVGPNRLQVCYKSADEDPMTGQNDALVTVNWPQSPVSRPESELIGSTYQDVEAQADLVITDPTSWILAGTGLSANQRLPGVVAGEFDRYVPNGSGPDNLDVITHSIVPNRDEQLLGHDLVHGGWRRGRVCQRQRLVGRGPLHQQTHPTERAAGQRTGDLRAPAADNGEPVRGHRDGAGLPHPTLTRELAHHLYPRVTLDGGALHRQRRLTARGASGGRT